MWKLGIIFFTIALHVNAKVEEVFKWSHVEFENLPQAENSYVGPYPYYIPENIDITSIGGYHPASGLFIVALARFRPGIPITLGAFCFNDYKSGSSPKIWGFPSYEASTFLPEDFAGGSLEENQERGLKKDLNDNGEESCLNTTDNVEDDETRKGYKKPNKKGQGHEIVQIVIPGNPNKVPIKVHEPPPADTRIISTFYTTIDQRCNRAYLMDHGLVQFYSNATYIIQKPAIVVIGLPSNGCKTRNFPFIHRAEVPDSIAAKGGDGFMAVTLDFQSKDSCDDLFIYVANSFNSYLVVYDYRKDKFWAIEHQTFLPVQAESQLVFNETFFYSLNLGIYSIELGFPNEEGDKIAYYTSLSGSALYTVSTKVLKNPRNFPANFKPDDFRMLGYLGTGHQPLRTIIDYKHEVMFFSEAQSHQIRCWNINKPLNPDYIDVIYESDKILFSTYVGLDPKGYLWFHTSHIPIDFLTNIPLYPQDVNSRSFRVKVEDAIRGTVCEN